MRSLLYALALSALVVVPSEAQQSSLRGVSLGIGLGIYQGELDVNSADNPIEFFASGNVGAMAIADGVVGPLVWEGGLSYQRVDIEVNDADIDVNVVGAEFTIGKDFRLLKRSRFLRVFAGIAPAYIGSTYNRTSTPDGCFYLDAELFEEAGSSVPGSCMGRNFLRNRDFENKPSRFSFYVPVGIVLQDAVRVSIRVFGTDYVDSVRRESTGPDWSPAVTLMYRFRI